MNFDTTVLPALGQSLDGFLIESQLGQGGMGAVYRVTKNGAQYAMKVLPNSYQSDPVRFEREAVALAAVRHPNIVTIHSFHREKQWVFIIFEFVDGHDLSSKIVRDQPWSLSDSIHFLKPLAEAIDAVHAQGIIHRDIKPANILIRTRDGAPLLTDFGIAKDRNLATMTEAGEVVGTINYMAPEQFEGQPVCCQTDLWAFAQVLYEMISGGQQPFLGNTPMQLASSVLAKDPVSPRKYNPQLPAGIDQLTVKMFKKSASERHSSASDLIKDCERLIQGEDLSPQPRSPLRSLYQGLIRRFGLKQARFISGVLVLFGILVLTIVTWLVFESWQAHSWEESTKKDIQSLGNKVVIEVQASPHAFTRHLLNSSPLECCAAVQSIREDFQGLESSIQSAMKDSFRGLKSQEYLSKLTKIQSRLRQLEWLHGLTEANEILLSNIPKRERSLAEALFLFRKEKYSEAYQAFQVVSGPSKDWLKPIQFATILSADRSGNYKATLQLLPNLRSIKIFEEQSDALSISANSDLCIAKLFNLRCNQKELGESFHAILKLAKANSRFLDDWNSQVLTKLNALPDRQSGRIEAVILRHRKLTYQFPSLSTLVLNEPLLMASFKSASEIEDNPKALLYLLRLKKRGITVPVPKGFQFAFDSQGKFDASKLSRELALSYFLKSRPLEKVLDYCLETARNGIYLDCFDDVEGRIIVYKSKLTDRALLKSPFDPTAIFWKNYCIQSEYSEKTINENIRVFLEVVKHPQLSTFYKAMIYEDLVGKLQQRGYNLVDKEKRTLALRCLALLDKAMKLPHPRPDKIYWRRYQLLRWRAKDDQSFDKTSLERLRCLEQFNKAIDERRQRSNQKKLHLGRPFGVPFAKDTKDLFLSRKANFYDQRGQLYFQSGDFATAEKDLLNAVEFISNPKTYEKLLSCVEKSKNQKAFVEVERLINIALSDPNRSEAYRVRVRALKPQVERVRAILGLK